MKERSRASREFAQRKLRYEEGFRAGMLRAAGIARESAAKARKFAAEDGGPINYEHETARAKEADSLATAIELEAGNVQKSEEKGD